MLNVSAVGLGGRLAVAGVGMYLKMKNPSMEIVSVEPSEKVVILGNSVLIICVQYYCCNKALIDLCDVN
jgi:cysteine synthase